MRTCDCTCRNFSQWKAGRSFARSSSNACAFRAQNYATHPTSNAGTAPGEFTMHPKDIVTEKERERLTICEERATATCAFRPNRTAILRKS